MKRLIIIATLLTGLMSSCDTCKTCTYTDETGTEQVTNETCGNDEDIASFEAELDSAWGGYGTVVCTEL